MTWQPQTCPLFLLVESITNKTHPYKIQNTLVVVETTVRLLCQILAMILLDK